MRKTFVAILVAIALSVVTADAAAQCNTCSMPQKPGNADALNAGLNDYYCNYYGGTYCDTAKTYAAAAGVPVFAPTGAQCNNAGLYNYLCRYYEYYGYGWDYSGYCSTTLTEATNNSCCACAGGCTMDQRPANVNASNAGLYDYYCSVYGGTYCNDAKTYASAASVKVFAPSGTQCNNAALYNYYCRWYEYNGYGWDYGSYCTTSLTQANANACCAPAALNTKAPEVQRLFFMRDGATGDSGVSTCDQGRSGRYTTPMYYVDLYRALNNAEVGTAGWGGYTLYQCVRGGPLGQSDEYLSTSSTCAAGSYYGSRVDYATPAGYTLAGGYEGTNSVALYLCSATAYDAYGGYWTELRVDPNACAAGSTQIQFLGYARAQPYVAGEKDGTMKGEADLCDPNHPCFGECGKDCDGLFGTHKKTSECLAHDRCVCEHGNNAWAMDCLGDFLLAGVSWVVSVFVSLVKTVIGFVVSVVKSIFRALCFWC